MRVILDAVLEERKGGKAARAERVHLSGHGLDDDEALESLKRMVLIWCLALEKRGELEKALRRRGIPWEEVGDHLAVELRPSVSDG